MTKLLTERPFPKIARPPECNEVDCHELAVVIVADGVALCGAAALAWYERERTK